MYSITIAVSPSCCIPRDLKQHVYISCMRLICPAFSVAPKERGPSVRFDWQTGLSVTDHRGNVPWFFSLNFKHHFALLLVTLTQKWFGNVKSPWIWATPPVSEGIWINLHTSIWLMLDSSKKSISAKLINVVLSSDWHLNKSKKKKKRSASNWDRKRERVHKQELCLLIHHKYADR